MYGELKMLLKVVGATSSECFLVSVLFTDRPIQRTDRWCKIAALLRQIRGDKVIKVREKDPDYRLHFIAGAWRYSHVLGNTASCAGKLTTG